MTRTAPGDDARLDSPSYARNIGPIRDALAPLLSGATGCALEIGCGPGRHAVALAAAWPALRWLPSDPYPEHRASAAAWAADAGLDNLDPPWALDAALDWAAEAMERAPFTLIYAFNVIHITPWTVTEGLMAGAGRVLAPGGWLALYGPFIEAGRPTGPGNVAFDAFLRGRDPDWGVRRLEDIDACARDAGLRDLRIARLPADNLLVAWRAPG